MKDSLLAAIRVITGCIGVLLFVFTVPGLAFDTKGCLTCHRYPGLVKLEQPESFVILHIDEDKHLSSPHGKVECKDCHSTISQIPHSEEEQVQCTSQCHSKDREKITDIESSYKERYHENEKFAITRLDDKSSCRVCHPLYPHSKNRKVGAFINMHTVYLTCEVCHLMKDNAGDLTYDWKEPNTFEFTGEPYGTHSTSTKGKTFQTEKLIRRMLRIYSPYDIQKESKQSKNNYIFRVAAFSYKNGKKKLIMNTDDCDMANEFNQHEQELSPREKEEKLHYFHRSVARKEVSIACNECHSPNGILDFSKLGFEEKRVKDLQYLNIKSLVTKYDTFILPNLFGR